MGRIATAIWAATPLPAKLALFATAVAVLAAAYAYVDGRGYHRADLEWRTKWAEREYAISRQAADEIARQAKANEDADELQRKAISDLLVQRDAAQALADELAEEARLDPNAGNVALDAEAVKRYNRSIAR